MDNAISKVKERLNLISGLNIYGVVLTAPFYFAASNSDLEKFFSDVSDASEYPLFLHDLPVVTKVKITYPLVEGLIRKGKIRGIKTGDIVLARQLYQFHPDFEVLYSNLDSFDVAMAYGIDKVLDGMFSCTPANAKGFIDSYFAGNKNESSKYLNNIIALRDKLVSFAPSALLYLFSEVMNGIGMEGIFCTDYQYVPNAEHAEKIKEIFRQYGEKC
jgi:4-hydroxy-tetrahydrodipicolinate synthase